MNAAKGVTERFLVVGAGFSGSLIAAILTCGGKQVTLIDRQRHPRFMIGESSTPTASLILQKLIDQYDLSELQPLTRYGDWVRELPGLDRGVKRGFSYFFHQAGRELSITDNHDHDLLVAASATMEVADTQWFRADVDQFLCDYASRLGVQVRQEVALIQLERGQMDDGWIATLKGSDGSTELIEADWIIDASGHSEAMTQILDLPRGQNDSLQTNTSTVFSHFEHVRSWDSQLTLMGQSTVDFPFPSDDAAQHHVWKDGWLWCLRFDQGRTSAGMVLNHQSGERFDDSWDAERVWNTVLDSYPGLRRMFQSAQLSKQPGEYIKTQRLQRIATQVSGPGWVSLPHTAGFIDPLHSTGIAHAMSGIERLADIFLSADACVQNKLDRYAKQVLEEFHLIDLLVAGCYRALPSKRHFEAFCMLYFAAATSYENRYGKSDADISSHQIFLAEDQKWVALVQEAYEQICQIAHSQNWGEPATFESFIREKIKPYNHVGLCDPQRASMYRYTALP